MSEAEVLFEFVQIRRQMRIAALHTATGIEVVVIAPTSATQAQMQQLALSKLKRKLAELPPAAPVKRLF